MFGLWAEELHVLLAVVYDAVREPDLWPAAFARIMLAVGGETYALFHWDAAATVSASVAAVSGYPKQAVAAYECHFARGDLRQPIMTGRPPGTVFVDDRDVSFHDFQQSEIYQRLFRPLGLGHGMAVTLHADPCRTSVFSVRRPLSLGGFAPAEITLFEALAPHLARALDLQRQVAVALQQANAMAAAIDLFQHPVFVVDSACRVIRASAAAVGLLRDPASPLRKEAGRLRATVPRMAGQLQDCVSIAVALANGRAAQPPTLLSLPKSNGNGTVSVAIAPFRSPTPVGPGDERLALLLVSDPARRAIPDREMLRRLFGLSRTEAELAVDLVAGRTLDAFAGKRGVSPETVRRQVKSAMAKTGTHSQAQLVGLIVRSLAMIRQS